MSANPLKTKNFRFILIQTYFVILFRRVGGSFPNCFVQSFSSAKSGDLVQEGTIKKTLPEAQRTQGIDSVS